MDDPRDRLAVCLADERLRQTLLGSIRRLTGNPVRVPRVALFDLGSPLKNCGGLQALP
jgi:hypothetical protein